MSGDDWTAALDDGLTGRLTHCTGGGARLASGIFGVYPGRVAAAYFLCPLCAHTDRLAVEAQGSR
jgi:hypothetical protein